MGKMKTLIEGLKGGVRRKLEALPPKARLGIVLTAFALFAVLCLYMTVTAIAGFGKGNGAMEIRHIENLDLPTQESMNLYNNVYGKGTEEE
ncbi:TraL conjugative transposon family protein [Bacteroides uniformis]|uniref:TraL conjugative transposon family protein n=1 Tax=Bacteroides uniformis TaxID=820 RepID=UPI00374D1AED